MQETEPVCAIPRAPDSLDAQNAALGAMSVRLVTGYQPVKRVFSRVWPTSDSVRTVRVDNSENVA